MKKLFLLLAAGFAFSSAIAQENTGMMFGHGIPFNHKGVPTTRYVSPKTQEKLARNKKPVSTTYDTTYANSAWFDYMDFQYNSTNGVIYYFDVYSDSSLIDPAAVSSTSDGNIWCHGIGMSFDPVDAGYYSGASTISTPISNADSFTIDSFQMEDKYIMHNTPASGADSVIIDFIVSDASMNGAYLLHYSPTTVGAYTVIAADDTPREFVADYMPDNWTISPPFKNDCWDSISTPVMERVAIGLDASYANDTNTTNGDHTLDMALPTPLYVSAGNKVMVYVHFKNATSYPEGTSTNSANYYHLFAGDPNGIIPVQSAGSYQMGLISQQQNDYGFPTYGGHNLLFSAADFYDATQPGPFGFEVPYFLFFVEYPPVITVHNNGVANIINAESVKASPNPTANEVTVSFSLTTTADVTATLSDMMGQVVATQNVANTSKGSVQFSTAALPSGIYFYTLNAGGQHTTGRIAVAH